jgi:hypothetical protein
MYHDFTRAMKTSTKNSSYLSSSLKHGAGNNAQRATECLVAPVIEVALMIKITSLDFSALSLDCS